MISQHKKPFDLCLRGGCRRVVSRQRHVLDVSTPDKRLRADCDFVERLRKDVQHLVIATSVQGMRLGDLKSFENAALWKDNALVNEVCWTVSNEEINRRAKKKITNELGMAASQAATRLQNLVYALKGSKTVFK